MNVVRFCKPQTFEGLQAHLTTISPDAAHNLMQPLNARRIAPAASPPAEDSSQWFQSAHPTAAGKSGIKRASTACQNCKNIKRKCDQKQPCSNCLKTAIDCIYDQAQDGRRRAARKRNVEELELKRDALDTILDAFRQSNDDTVQGLLSLIRGNASLDDIIQYALVHSEGSSDVHLATLAVAASSGFPRRSVLSINALCDTPTIRVVAAPWTSVTDDNDLVSHLVSTYFTWYHPAYPCVIQDLFVEAMNSQELGTTFCCPLLVNSILAIACHFSDNPGVFKDPSDPRSRGQHFLDHAMQLWREAGHLLRLTTVQAGQQIALALTLCGKDRLGYLYMSQTKALAEDVAFQIQRIPNIAPHFLEMQRALSLALWSRYMLSVDYNLAFMRAPDHTRPSVDRLSKDDPAFQSGALWQPYPNQEPSIQTNFGKFAHLQYDMHEIGADIASFVFGEAGNDEEKFYDLEQRLSAFSARIPWSDESATLNPHIMDLNLSYHIMRITLFNFAKVPAAKPDRVSSARQESAFHSQEECLTSARVIGSLHRRYVHDYGSRNLTIWMPQSAICAAYLLIEHLDQPEIQDVFHDVCVTLTSVSRRWYSMRGHSRMLYITAAQSGRSMSDRTRKILDRIAVNSWKPDEHKLYDGSVFPNYMLAKSEDPRGTGMGEILQLWANTTGQIDVSHQTPAGESDSFQSTSSGPEISDEMSTS